MYTQGHSRPGKPRLKETAAMNLKDFREAAGRFGYPIEFAE